MRHRHNGPKVQYRTKKGKTRYRERPIHSQYFMNKHKSMSYKQLRKEYKIPRYDDDDADGVKNWEDCRPWDKKKHILFFSSSDDDINIDEFEELSEEEKEEYREKELEREVEEKEKELYEKLREE